MDWRVTLRRGGWALLLFLPTVASSQSEELISQLERRIPDWLARYDVPGVSVAVIRDARPVWSQGFGIADVESGRPVRSGTIFQTGQLAQFLTAWGVMTLVERGKINLDDPVDRHLRQWDLPLSPYKHSEVTVRRLLNHSGGVLQQTFPVRRQPDERPNLKSLVSGLADDLPPVRIIYRPGSEYRYSDPGYSLLEMIMEDVSGDTFSIYIKRTVLQPLGMGHSNFSWEAVPKEWRASPHDGNGYPLSPFYADQRAAYGFNSSADDMARFVAANLPSLKAAVQGYPVLSKGSIQRMQRVQEDAPGLPSSAGGLNYGLGCRVEQSSRGFTVISQGGFAPPGWQAQLFAIPQTGDGLVVLTNSSNALPLITLVTKAWSSAIGIGSLQLVRHLRALQWRIVLGTGITALSALGLGLLFVWQARRGERRRATRHWWLRTAALLFLGGGFLVSWTMGRDLQLYQISYFTNWLSVSASCLCLVLALLVLFPRRT